MLSDGFILKREDRSQKDIYIQLINYAGLSKQRRPSEEELISIAAEPEEHYSPDTNIYKFVNQLEIVGNEKRIPDVTIKLLNEVRAAKLLLGNSKIRGLR